MINTYNILNIKNNYNSTFRNKFTQEEDNKLKYLVETLKIKKWSEISKHLPGRNTKQCRDRYSNYLSPNLTNQIWSNEEDQLLEKLVNQHGTKWVYLSQFFNGRSGNNLKNRWHKVLNKNDNDNNEHYLNDNFEKKQIRIAKIDLNKFNYQNNQLIFNNNKEIFNLFNFDSIELL